MNYFLIILLSIVSTFLTKIFLLNYSIKIFLIFLLSLIIYELISKINILRTTNNKFKFDAFKNSNYEISLEHNQINIEQIFPLFDNSAMATVIVNNELHIIFANISSKTTLNLENQSVDLFTSILTEESVTKLDLALKKNIDHKLLAIELKLKKDDKTILLYANKLNYKPEQYFIFNIIDATKYKTLETSLVHSQKMQALGQLSGGIAHDFNNLLTAITGFCDLLLLRHPPGDKSFSELMQIKQNANRAANLVRQLLAFSRKQVMQPHVIDITDSIADLSNLVTRLIGRDIELSIEHGRDLFLVRVDQSQFEQVIVNLVVNARDAMPSGGKLKIETKNIIIDEKFDEAEYYAPVGDEIIAYGNYVLITISDNGSGIETKILDKIFEPFFSTKDISSGTGLGLATVFGIINQTGGYIRVKTFICQGTTFYIFLKSVDPKDNDQPKIIKTMEQEESTDNLLLKDANQKGKILVVEDEAPVRLFSVYALTNKGYEVLEADSAETALELISKHGNQIDLVITDVVMPGMTGPKMVERVRVSYPKIKFIFTSGYAEDAIEYLSNIDCHFLSKPYSLRDLLEKVGELLAKQEN